MAKTKNQKANGFRPVLDLPVEFGGVSIGDQSARLGIRIDRSVLNIVAADETFCGHRLSGILVLGGHDESPGQANLFDDLHERLKGSFDVKRISANAKQIGASLTFSLADIDIQTLARFSRGAGRLVVEAVNELPIEQEDDDLADEETPGTLKSEGPWRDVPLSDLFDGSLLKSLKKADLTTVGELADYTASDRRLTDVEGIGPGKAAKIEDRMLRFWKENPDAREREEAAK